MPMAFFPSGQRPRTFRQLSRTQTCARLRRVSLADVTGEKNPMRRPKVYTQRTKYSFRAELTTCRTCGTRLRRSATRSEHTVITLDGPIQITHCGDRCPDSDCPTHARSDRSAAADALALPGFTFGL